MTGTCYHCGKESPVEFGYYICDNCDKEDKIQCPMNIKGLCQAECADICEYSSRCISMVHEPKKKTFLNNEKEIRFLIDLLRGMPEASVVVAKEKEHFYDVFKRVFGISDLEKEISELKEIDGDNHRQHGRSIEKYRKEINELRKKMDEFDWGKYWLKHDTKFDKINERIDELKASSAPHTENSLDITELYDRELKWDGYSKYINKTIAELKEQVRLHQTEIDVNNAFLDDVSDIKEVLREFRQWVRDLIFFLKWTSNLESLEENDMTLEELLHRHDYTKLGGDSIDYKKKYEDCVESKVSISKVPQHWVDDAFPEIKGGEKSVGDNTALSNSQVAVREIPLKTNSKPPKSCNDCDFYGICDHQGAYKIDDKWCYEAAKEKYFGEDKE